MFQNTYKKEFIAKAAIELMKEVVRTDHEHGIISDTTEGEDLTTAIEWQARRAAIMAEKLAQELDDRWHDGQTVFFDPQDPPMNGRELIASAINDFAEKFFEDK